MIHSAIPLRRYNLFESFTSMPKRKIVSEGTVFAVPLQPSGFAVGVVARTSAQNILLCYFFGPKRAQIPSPGSLEKLRAKDAIARKIVSDMGLIRGHWPVICKVAHWNRADWPMPEFVRVEPGSNRIWRVIYVDDDPSTLLREEAITTKGNLEHDGLCGYKAAEAVLTKLLAESTHVE